MNDIVVDCPNCDKENKIMFRNIEDFHPVIFHECEFCNVLFPVKIEKVVKYKGTAYKNYTDIEFNDNVGYSITEHIGDESKDE